jgi:hypothetical protein
MKTKIFYAVFAFLLFLPLTALAIPQLINYQGRLADGTGTPVTGTKSITFKIYSSSSAPTARWTETQTVTVTNGIFNVILGSVSSLSGSVLGGDKAYLGVTVSPDAEMSPRQRITSVGYAYRAAQAEGVISPLNVLYGGMTSPAAYFWATSTANTNPAIFANTTGLGNAGKFMSTNSLNTNPAIYAETRGTGQAIHAKHSGIEGNAGRFEISSPDNSYNAIMAETIGNYGAAVYASSSGNSGNTIVSRNVGYSGDSFMSSAGNFEVENMSSNATAITARSGGIGDTAYFDANDYNPANTVHAISRGTATATAGHFEVDYKNSPATALFANTTGIGNAAIIKITNNANSRAALYATTDGSGDAGYFGGKVHVTGNLTVDGTISGNGSGMTGVLTTAGGGTASSTITVNQGSATYAGSFNVMNTSSTADCLYASTAGRGYAFHAYANNNNVLGAGLFEIANSGCINPALTAKTNGNGDALYAWNSGTGYAGHFVGPVSVSGSLAVTGTISGNGSSITNIPATQGGIVYAALANGTTAMALGTNTCVRVTPTATATYTTTVPAAGVQCTVIILTSGTTSYTIAFGTGFRANGTITTGTTTARYHTVTFISDGSNLIETGRATAASGI